MDNFVNDVVVPADTVAGRRRQAYKRQLDERRARL